MNIIFLSGGSKGAAREISCGMLAVGFFASFLVISTVAVFGGYIWGAYGVGAEKDAQFVDVLRAEITLQKNDIDVAKQDAQGNINALTLRLAELQSRVIRLDALGLRLTEIAGLDKGEFNFKNVPAQGGPERAVSVLEEAKLSDFFVAFDALSAQLEDRQQQLRVLESLLMNRDLEDDVFPAGFPAEKGWVSSYFGQRTDPFTGRPATHEGIDIAGKEGTKILSVASGVVTWSGERYGYGMLVEINHGNGYVTRYGHNMEHLVQAGDTVKKGQAISLMGSSGRSTGPHVHFEVLRHGSVVNPLSYVSTSK